MKRVSPYESAAEPAKKVAPSPSNSQHSFKPNAFSMLMQTSSERTLALAAQAPSLVKSPHQIVDRLSRFIGHAARINCRKDVSRIQAVLKSDSVFRNATHNIQAWRFRKLISGKTGDKPEDFIIEDGYDEDGEDAAGKKLWNILREENACDCMIIVTRWYGGTHLGPVRFDHINNLGKSAIQYAGLSNTVNKPPLCSTSKWGSEAEKARILRMLKARTISINGYRKTVMEKFGQALELEKSIWILSSKPLEKFKSFLADELDESIIQDAPNTVDRNWEYLGQLEAESVLQEKDELLKKLKYASTKMKDIIVTQEQQVANLSMHVVANHRKES